MVTWTNAYVNYLDEVCFSKGYVSKQAALLARTKKSVTYIGKPIRIVLK
jgi:hypothetical protein